MDFGHKMLLGDRLRPNTQNCSVFSVVVDVVAWIHLLNLSSFYIVLSVVNALMGKNAEMCVVCLWMWVVQAKRERELRSTAKEASNKVR